MGLNFDALPHESKKAVLWKAKENLRMSLADGSARLLRNQDKFIENNCESLAAKEQGLPYILEEYKAAIAADGED